MTRARRGWGRDLGGRSNWPRQQQLDLGAGNPAREGVLLPRLSKVRGGSAPIATSEQLAEPVDTPELRKARGAFFTPSELTDFLANWAIKAGKDVVLEPSCGEAAFLLSAGRRLRALGIDRDVRDQLHGIELHPASAEEAHALLRTVDLEATIRVGDFFDFEATDRYDAVVGNPPYVRYQGFTGSARLSGQRAALAQGVRLTGLASSWAGFVVHASGFLKPDGRLALVIPAELLTVNYAADVRRYLMSRFAKVGLVAFEERVFPGVLEEVILLLAEGQGPTDHFELYKARNLNDLKNFEELGCSWVPPDPHGKWTAALVDPVAAERYTQVTSSTSFTPLHTWGETSLGMVTGNNRYFALTERETAVLKLPASELLHISPPGSRHLRNVVFGRKKWEELAAQEKRVYLFYPRSDEPSSGARRYIAEGELLGVDEAYKCRVREPWWRVPLVAVPDLFFTYMNHVTPRLVTNRAGVHHLNSIHGVYLREGLNRLGRDLLPLAALNTVTILGAEMVGRSYGGGILKVEPKEADRLPVLSADLLLAASQELRALRPQVRTLLEEGQVLRAVEMIDAIVLGNYTGMTNDEIALLRGAREALFNRRQARAGK